MLTLASFYTKGASQEYNIISFRITARRQTTCAAFPRKTDWNMPCLTAFSGQNVPENRNFAL